MADVSSTERQWWNQLRCGNALERARAALTLGAIAERRGDVGEAEDLLVDAAYGKDGAASARGSMRLGRLLMSKNHLGDAARAFDRAATQADSTATPDVLLDLGMRWVTLGDFQRAEQAYRAVVTDKAVTDHLRALGAYRLGHLCVERDRVLEALRNWYWALDRAAESLRPYILYALGDYRASLIGEDDDEARQLFAEVIESDHPDLAPKSALRLAHFHYSEGEGLEAFRLAELVIGSEHPQFLADAEALRNQILSEELDQLISTTDEMEADQLSLTDATAELVSLDGSHRQSCAWSWLRDENNRAVESPFIRVLETWLTHSRLENHVRYPAEQDAETIWADHPRMATSVPVWNWPARDQDFSLTRCRRRDKNATSSEENGTIQAAKGVGKSLGIALWLGAVFNRLLASSLTRRADDQRRREWRCQLAALPFEGDSLPANEVYSGGKHISVYVARSPGSTSKEENESCLLLDELQGLSPKLAEAVEESLAELWFVPSIRTRGVAECTCAMTSGSDLMTDRS